MATVPAPPPLLEPFFQQGGGCVLYKAYVPQRGDDVQALVQLAAKLPSSVQFKPLAPRRSFLLDVRDLLPEILTDFADDLGVTGDYSSETPWLPRPTDSAIPAGLRPFFATAADRVFGRNERPSDLDIYRRLLETHREVVQVLLRFVYPPTKTVYGQSTPQEAESTSKDGQRPQIHLSDESPILVIGRPGDFTGYWDTPLGRESADFRKLMDQASYPNRFFFKYTKLASRPGICDRKTQRFHAEENDGRHDVGFIFASRLDNGQPVIVATGASSLGTYAAVRLLLKNRPDIRRAAERFHQAQGPTCLDIAFRCRLERLAEDRPFPLGHSPQHLRIQILNSDDFLGYGWSRSAYESMSFLFAEKGETPASPHSVPDHASVQHANTESQERCAVRASSVSWTVRDTHRVGELYLRRVDLEVDEEEAVTMGGGQVLLPSGPMHDVVAKIQGDLESDREDWAKLLEEWKGRGKHALDGIERDLAYRTFRPILLLGPTGTGKQWIAELIAQKWAGKTLEASQREGKPQPTLSTARNSLAWMLDDWEEQQAEGKTNDDRSSQLLTFSAVSCGASLLNAELFGIADKRATEVGERPGAFVMAGTGVLFLDEVLELPLEQQSRLLVALQTGRVRPVGAGEYAYVSRLVAATNRASTEGELERLIKKGTVRRDLIARFSHRYTIPPLAERGLEILPILVMLIRRERLMWKDRTRPIFLRVSRSAMEVLACHAYPENVRDLRRLADSLPRKLVDSFTWALDSDPGDKPLSDFAVCLDHLAYLGVPKGKSGVRENAHGQTGTPLEDEVFEFRLTFSASRIIATGDRLNFKDCPLLNELYEFQEDLTRIRQAIGTCVSVEETMQEGRLKSCIKEDIWAEFKQVHKVLREMHDRLKEQDMSSRGLRISAVKTELDRFHKQNREHADFFRFAKLDEHFSLPAPDKKDIERLVKWNDWIQDLVAELDKGINEERKKQLRQGGLKVRSGKEPGVIRGIMLSVLTGYGFEESWARDPARARVGE